MGRPGRPLDNPDSKSSGPETLVSYAELVVLCQVQQAVAKEAAAFFQEAKQPPLRMPASVEQMSTSW